jgi:putative PIN family toxin of toxin-antitoxin system
MLSVTADSNVYVSAFLRGGPAARLLGFARAGQVRVDTSEAILDEVLRVMRDNFGWSGEMMRHTRWQLEAFANKVQPNEVLDVVKDDPSDNRILECAQAAGSDYIVSLDHHLLRLKDFAGAPIVTVADFLRQERSR